MFDCHLFESYNDKKGEKKGQSLGYQFEQTMESEDASNEEASHCNPPKMDLTNNEHLEAISMLLMMATEDRLKRGSIMAIPKRFNVACSTIHILWKCVELMHAMGITNYAELLSRKNSRRVPKYLPEFIEEGIKSVLLRKRCTQQKLAKLMGMSKTTGHHWIVALTLCVHSNSLKPSLTEENRLARFEMAMDSRNPDDLTKYQDMHDQIHVDEKWFFFTKEKERYLLHQYENPKALCQTQIAYF